MAALVIRNLPEELHAKLKARAVRHHRSMNREAIALLEEALSENGGVREVPPPYQGNFPLSGDFIDDAKKKGRS